MPRVIIGATSSPRLAETLAQRLADELSSPGDQAQPLIIERHIGATRSRHVWVVWDRWSDLEAEERTAVITDAYAKAEGFDAADNISIAIGILPEEAVVLGALPWVVQPTDAQLHAGNDYRKARSLEARNTVLGEAAKELRYPTEEEAKQAVDRLRQHSPQTSWVVRQDADTDEED